MIVWHTVDGVAYPIVVQQRVSLEGAKFAHYNDGVILVSPAMFSLLRSDPGIFLRGLKVLTPGQPLAYYVDEVLGAVWRELYSVERLALGNRGKAQAASGSPTSTRGRRGGAS